MNHIKLLLLLHLEEEDLIPDMFTAIVNEYNSDNKLDKFVY